MKNDDEKVVDFDIDLYIESEETAVESVIKMVDSLFANAERLGLSDICSMRMLLIGALFDKMVRSGHVACALETIRVVEENHKKEFYAHKHMN